MAAVAKAPQVIDWTRRPYEFIPHDGGRRGVLQSWASHGSRPEVGDLLALRNGNAASVYRVLEFGPDHVAAEYDGYVMRVEFVPGSTIAAD